MSRQHQIKISVSKKLDEIIQERAEKLGVKKSTYCFNIIFEQIRQEEKR
jgi:hypothetical protein